MSSRLFISLRERSGLAYYVKTSAELYSDSGYLSTQAGIAKGKAEASLNIILEEYRRIAREDVSEEELSRAKDLVTGRLLMQLETSDEVATWYGRQAILRSTFITPEELSKRVRALQVRDIRQVAAEIMTNNGLNLAIIGPITASDKKSLQKILNF
jgi:predicted Zn-dependent peptidase